MEEGGGLREGGLIKGRNEAWTARGKDGREEASGGGIERGSEDARGKGSKGGKKTSREVSRGGYRPVYSVYIYIHKPFHNTALGLETLVLQMKNSEQV